MTEIDLTCAQCRHHIGVHCDPKTGEPGKCFKDNCNCQQFRRNHLPTIIDPICARCRHPKSFHVPHMGCVYLIGYIDSPAQFCNCSYFMPSPNTILWRTIKLKAPLGLVRNMTDDVYRFRWSIKVHRLFVVEVPCPKIMATVIMYFASLFQEKES